MSSEKLTNQVRNNINTKNMTEEEWLEVRRYSIGGSDAGAILGFNKYESPFSLYQKKLHPELFEQDLSDNEFIYWGNTLEDIVAKEFERRTGKKVRRHNSMMYHKDPEYNFMSANVDRVVISEKAILECKTASEYKKDEWKDGNVPASYMAQCYHYLAVTGYERAYIAVLIGGNHFVWTTIERDEEIIESIMQTEKDFWDNHILKEIPPEADGSSATSEALNKLWQETTDNEVSFDDQQAAHFKALQAENKIIKEAKERKMYHENKIKEMLGDSEVGASSQYRATWKPQTSIRLDTKRLKKERPELFDEYAKESKSRPLKVKEL